MGQLFAVPGARPLDDAFPMRRSAWIAVILCAACAALVDGLRAFQAANLRIGVRARTATYGSPIVPEHCALVLAASEHRGFGNQAIKAIDAHGLLDVRTASPAQP